MDDLLASDSEREHVIELLQRAVGQGMLDLTEFGERTDAVLAARTRSDLNAVLLDLPDLLPDEPAVTDVLVLRSVLSEVRRTGRWLVPARLLITSRLGATRLDFTDAVLAQPRVSVDLAVTGGVIELKVPRRATVLTTGVRVTGGRVVDRCKPAEHRQVEPRFVLGGRLLAGEVRIVRPTFWRRLRLRRR
ncbi:MAG TPA: DUF1707 domain-containing protein [Pseudonocardiaceae bacterium]|nr:DUF1707 domain-containing protein [Pseudonocardiaceae bacterium]